MKNNIIESSSFRDPSGFLFWKEDILYRQINLSYKQDYEFLMNSGLYKKLVKSNLLIPHEETEVKLENTKDHFKTIKPDFIPMISYPYEWCFSQLKHAAQTTLKIQKTAFEYGMVLKDCSAYNIQFNNGKPILIDSLSFEIYKEGQIWKGYKQFCQHFLAPLVLMSHKDIRLGQLLKIFIDGIPLDLTAQLLPLRTRSMFSIFSHIHAHAKSQKHYENKKIKQPKMSKTSFMGLVSSLDTAIKKQNWKSEETEWGDYYSDTNYAQESFEEKKQIVGNFLDKIKPQMLWDIGGNTGIFSRISSNKNILTVSFDVDPTAVEKNYQETIEKNETKILPLLLDLTNPSPSIGWANNERKSFIKRGPVNTVLALALIHHMIISNNVSLEHLSSFFSQICTNLIIEFVPKSDSQVQRLLRNRKDIFNEYSIEKFEEEFKKKFDIDESIKLKNSERILYKMKKLC